MVEPYAIHEFQITGTHIWYYHICPRETWLIAHQIVADQDDSNIDYGRFLQENVYDREKKEITVGHLKIDIMKSKEGQLVIGEVKKSSATKESARLQLLFYLYELSQMGVAATGELLFPEERRKEQIILDEQAKLQVEKLKSKIIDLVQKEYPPPPQKTKYCKKCAYSEMCWS